MTGKQNRNQKGSASPRGEAERSEAQVRPAWASNWG